VTYDRRGFGQTPVSPLPFPHVDDLPAVLAGVAHLPQLERPDLVATLVLTACTSQPGP